MAQQALARYDFVISRRRYDAQDTSPEADAYGLWRFDPAADELLAPLPLDRLPLFLATWQGVGGAGSAGAALRRDLPELLEVAERHGPRVRGPAQRCRSRGLRHRSRLELIEVAHPDAARGRPGHARAVR